MKAYFSRLVPFYILTKEEITDSNGFDSYAVEVPESTVKFAQSARAITRDMEEFFTNSPAPEECAQDSADTLTALIRGSNYGEE